ncbi:hypothetical protein, partial [Flavobacterium restrictum]|uniref:hypothetical protein n=1 Tax=Flavobacterium restrictum TaxID=2594428 RepID=UPI001C8F76C3
ALAIRFICVHFTSTTRTAKHNKNPFLSAFCPSNPFHLCPFTLTTRTAKRNKKSVFVSVFP